MKLLMGVLCYKVILFPLFVGSKVNKFFVFERHLHDFGNGVYI